MAKADNRDLTLAALKEPKKLPTLPALYAALLEVVRDPDATSQEVAVVIGRDPIAAVRTLRVANSSFYGLKEPAEDLSTAIVYLGLNEIQNIAMGVGSLEIFGGTPRHRFLKELWQHSLATAALADEVARQLNHPNRAQAYLAGLLHDIGKLFFASCFMDEFLLAESESREKPRDLLTIETGIFGMTHLEAARYIVQHWQMPPHIGVAIEAHHDPLTVTGPDRLLTLCVGLANDLARHFDGSGDVFQSDRFGNWLAEARSQAGLGEDLSVNMALQLAEPVYGKARELAKNL